MKLAFIATLTASLIMPLAALAADHEVKMLNKGSDGTPMVFEPLVVYAQPGDTVTFIPTDRSHNSSSMKDGVPEGAQSWNGKVNEKITVTVTEAGVHMYQCTPHLAMGMVGAIVVGDPVNLDAVKALRYPGKAKATAQRIFDEIETGS